MGFSLSDLNPLNVINPGVGLITEGFNAVGDLLAPSLTVNVPPLPPLPEMPRPPTVDEAARNQDRQRRRRRGRASTILTGPQGAGTPVTATKVLLGG